MAPDGVEEAEYESDPEELKRSLATRRREASDDEDENLGEIQSADIDSDEQSAIVEFDNDAGEGLHVEGDDDSYDDEEEEGDYGEVDDNMEYVAGKGEPKGVEAAREDSVVDGEEPKQKEPFAVPTAGAFYMHDDRFQEFDAPPNRRMRGGRRLWPSRDERKWGHDKYDEMNTQEKPYDKRTSRGRARGRGQGRGQERGYSRGGNSEVFTNNGHHNQFPKAGTRGRGSRRYEVALRNGSQARSAQTKQSQNSFVKVSDVDSGRAPTETYSLENEARINVVASGLNSASPPFYPSGNLAQKDLQAGMGRLHVNGSPMPSGKKFGNTKSSSSWVQTTLSQTTSQGRGARSPGKVLNQGDNVISPRQIRGISKGTGESCQPPESATETGALVVKGEGTLQPSGRGSFMYGGTQFMGPGGGMAAGHGNPNFPAFLPVMQFGGQHGGVPTFGMALPGYVQPEHGTGSPEMTWLPILTGPGALGASYPPPYAAIYGSYHKPGFPSSAEFSSQENSSNNPTDEEKPLEITDATNNGTLQRSNSNPNKQPRRYSEMSFN
ncbi:unnamed protein product [Eruca vesicaria subsp. sativa]|uniref:Btz domain-containing protein n=1 Tax=Eruca vesicaria subsp. sativa TaxID=29727 RepID=A0ABC8L9S7_ERUVS|nr:unnamed protein product [Eruca vesicaria subsp. sativa]